MAFVPARQNEAVTTAEFKQILADTDKLVAVDFFAEWCSPCKMISSEFEKLEHTFSDVVFLKADVDQASDLSEEYRISALPTFRFFREGQEVKHFLGADKDALSQILESYRA